MDTAALKNYLADSPPTIVALPIAPHFNALNEQEKLYSHYLSVACFAGTRVVLRQVSPESEHIYDLIIELYHHCRGDWSSLKQASGLSDDDFTAFLNYSAQFLGNCGNFKSFGDSKFIPRLPQSQFEALAAQSAAALKLYQRVQASLYFTDEEHSLLGYPDKHVSNYYPDSPDITQQEITAISEFFDKHGLLPENTRVRKLNDASFEVLVASAQSAPAQQDMDVKQTTFELDGSLKGRKATIVFGDHSAEMKKIADAIGEAQKHAANSNEEQMCAEYVKSFETGSSEAYKQSQRWWIKDKMPMVETDIGFVETYRDPAGIRGEWEGFVAMINKSRTAAFTKLVESAPEQIPKLPWPAAFEKDKFLSPDFTSLEVLTFAGSGIPAGINIPNFNDIRQEEGFKNVSLGNVLSAKAPKEPIPFIKESDLDLYQKYRDPAFEVQVGLHELLGHGCGKLLQETSPGVFNFDHANPPINPVTNKPVDTWYKPKETWGSVFGNLGASYEECRAECVAMALCCDFDILSIFGFTGGIDGEAGDVLYAAYLSMARAGIAALEFWDPKSKKWGQAHMQARFSILQTFLSAGKEFASLDYTKDDLSDLTIRIERSKILSHGRPVVESYLQKLGIFKATADVKAGTKLYTDITTVDDWYATKVRPEVLRRKTPRKVYVQANTVLEGGRVILKEYEASPAGMIQSYAERTYV